MKNYCLFLLSLCGLCLLAACGGSGSTGMHVGSATHFSVSAPASVGSGTAFSVTVTALDASNNVVTSYSGTVHFTSTDVQAVLAANTALTNGTGTFSATLKSTGVQTITATDTMTASITGTSSSIAVSSTNGAATHFSVIAPATATTGTPFNFSVTALDPSNNVVTVYSGTVHFTSTDGQAVLPANSTLTFGVGNFSATLKTLGSQTIKAIDSVTTSITGTSNAVAVGSNAATHFSFTTPAGATKGTAFAFQVTALDVASNVATGYSGTTHFTSTDTLAVVPANSTLTNGEGNFSATLNTLSGQKITATDTVTASINGTSNLITVFSSCTPKGGQCPPQRPPCCPGLVCTAATDRAICEPSGAESPFPKKDDTFTPRTHERESRFGATCIMGAARESHTATLLSNGLVLITGGDDRTVSLATAELFNSDTHSFAPAGNMADARAMHTATLLANGDVLVIGGRDSSGSALATAELFAPASASFAPAVASMSISRESHTATLFSNGKVLIAGGNDGAVTLATAELFDPAASSFTPTGRMHAAREFHTATLLGNGKILVVGGRDAEGKALATAELFDPTSGIFAPAGSMSTPRESHTATLLSNGKVLISGGDSGIESLATAELFDPTSGRFTPTGSMHLAREFHTATLRNDGTVLVVGGATLASTEDGSAQAGFLPESTTAAELFDPASGSFIPTSDMANARARHATILLPDGRVLVIGGITPDISVLANSLASAELFQ